jgi:DNA-binding CsgD family transcriptional regulator
LAVLNRAWDLSAALGGVAAHREYGPDLVRIALAAGDSDRAQAVAGAIEAVAQRLRLPGLQGAAWLCRSLISRDPEGLLRAVQAYRGSPRPVELAYALEEAGVALGSVGRSGEAVPILQEAAQIHDRVGAFRDLARVEARLRSLGAPQGRRGRRRRPQTGWQSLTATERQVVHLVSEGLRNRQVAERLFISTRTVQTHLTHIFQKLDLSSRGELIAETFRQQR